MGFQSFIKFSAVSASTFCTIFALSASARADDAIIHITRASYGYAGDRKDVTEDVTRYCEGKLSCKFLVKNESFALHPPIDPSVDNPKGVITAWKCGETEHKYQFVEGHEASIDCK